MKLILFYFVDLQTFDNPITVYTYSVHTPANTEEYFEIWTIDSSYNANNQSSEIEVHQTDGWQMTGCGIAYCEGLSLQTDLSVSNEY